MNPAAKRWAHIPGVVYPVKKSDIFANLPGVAYPSRRASSEPPRCKTGNHFAPNPPSKSQRALVVQKYKSMQYSIKKIAADAGLGMRTVSRILKEEGIEIRPSGVRLDCIKKRLGGAAK